MLQRSVVLRLMAPLAIFALLVLILIAISVSTTRNVATAHAGVEAAQQQMIDFTELRSLSRSLQRDTLNLAIETDPRALPVIRQKLHARSAEMARQLADADRVLETTHAPERARYVATQDEVLRELARASALAMSGRRAEALTVFRSRVRPAERAASEIADRLIDGQSGRATALAALTRDIERNERGFMLVSAAVLSSIALVMTWYLSAVTIARPLVRLGSTMQAIAAGDLALGVPFLSRPDGIGEMARAVEVFRISSNDRHRLQADAEATRLDTLRRQLRQEEAERNAREQTRAETHASGALEDQRRSLLGTLADGLESSVQTVVARLQASSDALARSATRLADQAAATATDVDTAAGAAETARDGAAAAAAATEELVESIGEIDRQSDATSDSAADATARARFALDEMDRLCGSVAEIGTVTTVIARVTRQINLLALNASIEAAHAGQAGNGFSVVAKEVKMLAGETAHATQDIRRQIAEMQAGAEAAAAAMTQTSMAIADIEAQTCTAAAVIVQQNQASHAINRNVLNAADAAVRVQTGITGVAAAMNGVERLAEQMLEDAGRMADDAVEVDAVLRSFVVQLRGA